MPATQTQQNAAGGPQTTDSPPTAITQLQQNAELGYELGAREGLAGVKKAANLAQGAFTLLFTLIILAVAALVGGEFISAIPTDGPFGNTTTQLEDNASTGFTLFAVGLLIIPAAALIGYLYTNLGGMMNRMNGGRR